MLKGKRKREEKREEKKGLSQGCIKGDGGWEAPSYHRCQAIIGTKTQYMAT
jgi:hypothetical protein